MSSIVALAAIIGLDGCAKKQPPPLAPPGVSVNVDHFYGTPLSGARPSTQPANLDDALIVRARLYALEQMPRGAASPVGAEARLIAATRAGIPVLPSSRLSADAQVAIAGQADALRADLETGRIGRVAEAGDSVAALAPGTTASVEVADDPQPRRATVQLARPADRPDELHLALVLQDLVAVTDNADANAEPVDPREADAAEAAQRPVQRSMQREVALLGPILMSERVPVVFLIPFEFSRSGAVAVAVCIEASRAAEQEDAGVASTARAAAAEQLAASADAAAHRPDVAASAVELSPGLRVAMEALSRPTSRRAALVYLADQTGADLCQDVALVADHQALDALAQAILARAAETRVSDSPDDLRWLLDAATLSWLITTPPEAATARQPELTAALLFHCGEVGRDGETLAELLAASSNRDDLDQRLMAENLIYLEDSSPGSRVRAYDWLRARGRAPEGFDPLGDVRERRLALERALAAPAAAPAATPVPAAGSSSP